MKNIHLGEKIRQVRILKELTQAYLAHVVGCSGKHISQIESGKVECDDKTLTLIKKALDIPKAPLTEEELEVYRSQIWVWHDQINTRRISYAETMKDELASILHLPFEHV
ncbi:MAG: helix-turn-helix domain-containing protein [Defluviitaleaceae bacterium]|nr:helix-turn-helix domain-containing protein [Defluviitaleaceae bacterium]